MSMRKLHEASLFSATQRNDSATVLSLQRIIREGMWGVDDEGLT